MQRRLLSLLLFVLAAVCASRSVHAQFPPSVQGGAGEIPDDRIEVRRRLDSFEKLAKDVEKDADAVKLLDGMVVMCGESAPRDRARIQKAIIACVRSFDPPKDKTKPRQLPIAAADVMARMGTEAIKPITELLSDARVGKDMDRVRPLTAGLVKLSTGNPEALEASLKFLSDANPRLYAGIVPALASFELETQGKRKKLVAAILAAHETFATRVEKDKSIAVDAKAAFADGGNVSTMATLNALATQKQPDVAAFKTWFGENKGKDWPEK